MCVCVCVVCKNPGEGGGACCSNRIVQRGVVQEDRWWAMGVWQGGACVGGSV